MLFLFPCATNFGNLDFAFFFGHFPLVSDCSSSKFSNVYSRMNVLELNCFMKAVNSYSQNGEKGKHPSHPGARALPRYFCHLSLSSTMWDSLLLSTGFPGCSQRNGRREVSPLLLIHTQASTHKGKNTVNLSVTSGSCQPLLGTLTVVFLVQGGRGRKQGRPYKLSLIKQAVIITSGYLVFT